MKVYELIAALAKLDQGAEVILYVNEDNALMRGWTTEGESLYFKADPEHEYQGLTNYVYLTDKDW